MVMSRPAVARRSSASTISPPRRALSRSNWRRRQDLHQGRHGIAERPYHPDRRRFCDSQRHGWTSAEHHRADRQLARQPRQCLRADSCGRRGDLRYGDRDRQAGCTRRRLSDQLVRGGDQPDEIGRARPARHQERTASSPTIRSPSTPASPARMAWRSTAAAQLPSRAATPWR